MFLNLESILVSHISYFLDEKAGSAENKSSKNETSSEEQQSGQSRATSAPATVSEEQQPGQTRAGSAQTTGFPANPFDFSAMTGLLNVKYFFSFPLIYILCYMYDVHCSN